MVRLKIGGLIHEFLGISEFFSSDCSSVERFGASTPLDSPARSSFDDHPKLYTDPPIQVVPEHRYTDEIHRYIGCANLMSPMQTQNGVVTINVGGTLYTTFLATLTRFPDSMLATMFSDKHTIATDAHGNVFIDRDGEIFRHVLNFLRGPEEFEPATLNPHLSRDLQNEARYYGLLNEMFPFKQRTCNVFVGSINRQNLIYSEKKVDNSHWVDWAVVKAIVSRNDVGTFFISCSPGHQPLRFSMIPLAFCTTCNRMHAILQPEHHNIVTIAMARNEENIEDRRLILQLHARDFAVDPASRDIAEQLRPQFKVFRDQCGECYEHHDP